MCCCDFESVQANECMHNAPQHCTARERQKRRKKERRSICIRETITMLHSHAPSLCLRVSRSTLASTIWCISNIVYLHLHTNCISLFVSKVVHASQINATQTLSHTQTHSDTHRIFPNGTISIISICNKCPRWQNFCLHNQYTWHFRSFAVVEFTLETIYEQHECVHNLHSI